MNIALGILYKLLLKDAVDRKVNGFLDTVLKVLNCILAVVILTITAAVGIKYFAEKKRKIKLINGN